MIWALLEITLPLCLSFLFGLVAGWLFWRWRRRSISQAEWNSYTSSKDAPAVSLNSLKQDHSASELKFKTDKLEATIEKQKSDLLESQKSVQQLNEKLKAANDKLAAPTNESNAVNVELTSLQTTLARVNSEKADIERKFQDASNRAEQQTKVANELQQKLKQSETVASERDTALTRIKELEGSLADGNLKNNELEQTKSQLATVDQKFKNFQASVVANRDLVEQEKVNFQNRINELQSQLEQARSGSAGSSADKQKLQLLEAQLKQANNSTEELNQAKANIVSLNKQLHEARELARSTQSANDSNPQQSNQLARQNSDLYRQLQQAKTENRELNEVRTKLAETTTQLNNARARNNQLAASVDSKATPATAVTPISVGQIKKLKTEIEERDQLIAQLQKKAKRKPAKTNSKAAKPAANKGSKSKSKTAWQKGETKIGTPGCDHKDDLTAINGIGPQIQKVLNRLGIKSWEQLATLKAADVKLVDEALVEFSGRIKRDEWVPQAKAIMRNGHQPLAAGQKNTGKKPKKAAKSKTGKKAWQKGKTKFGTPGAAHRDDLKVINGIGPVIEKSLNKFGVKSWEQLATLKVKEVKAIDEALDFPGRIAREQWVQQAKVLVKQFPDRGERPTRRTFLNKVG